MPKFEVVRSHGAALRVSSWTETAEVTPSTEAFLDPDDLFAGLDGSECVIAGQSRHIEVYGVFDEGLARWVQIGIPGVAEPAVTVRIRQGEGPTAVLDALTLWSDDPQRSTITPPPS